VKIEETQRLEQIVLDAKSSNMRQYLLDLVLPCLSEGVLEVLQKRPEFPIQQLVPIIHVDRLFKSQGPQVRPRKRLQKEK